MYQIDLNSDLGESFGAWRIGNDEEIIRRVTSVNVACGFHAGDPVVMDRVVRLAKENGVAVGAHPGYPDLQGFGRRAMALSENEILCCVRYQLGALRAFAESYGLRLQHVKPHGALYNRCQHDAAAARAVCLAVRGVDPGLRLYAAAGSALGGAQRRSCPGSHTVTVERNATP